MTSKAKKIDFIPITEANCFSVYTEVETKNNVIYDLIGHIVFNLNVNRYGFQPSKEPTCYSEFTLRKIANFISKLNKNLEQKDLDDDEFYSTGW